MIESHFQINIIVLNKCASTLWQPYWISIGSQSQTQFMRRLKALGKKDDAVGHHTRKGNRDDTRDSAEYILDLAMFNLMSHKSSDPMSQHHPIKNARITSGDRIY